MKLRRFGTVAKRQGLARPFAVASFRQLQQHLLTNTVSMLVTVLPLLELLLFKSSLFFLQSKFVRRAFTGLGVSQCKSQGQATNDVVFYAEEDVSALKSPLIMAPRR